MDIVNEKVVNGTWVNLSKVVGKGINHTVAVIEDEYEEEFPVLGKTIEVKKAEGDGRNWANFASTNRSKSAGINLKYVKPQ